MKVVSITAIDQPLSTALDYITKVLAGSPAVTPVVEPTCPTCLGEGEILVRHEELDETWMAEVWMTETCPDCQKGRDLQDSFESQMFEAQERW